MTPPPISGFLTKTEVEELYGRSHRSLTRDFSAAVRLKDQKVLTHLKLQTEDGKVRQGTEVSLEQIQELSNKGLSPTWYVEGNWAAERYGARTTAANESTPAKAREKQPSDGKPPAASVGEGELVRRLEEQIQDLQRDKEKLYNELSIKNEQIQQANDRTRESNVLMKELQTLLGNVQARALLPLPTQPTPHASARRTTDIINGVESGEPVEAKSATVTPSKPRARSEKGSVRSKSKVPPEKSEPVATVPEKPKWYEMPTFGRIISRRK
jgi:hypothetical protein